MKTEGLPWAKRSELLLRRNEDCLIRPYRLAHLYAREYTELGHVSPEQYDACFTFAVVRAPYTRLLSEYNARYPYQQKKGFGAFLNSVTDDGKQPPPATAGAVAVGHRGLDHRRREVSAP